MRAEIMGLLLNAVLFAGSAWAYDAQGISNCNGVEWDESHALVVSKITAVPRINFIKSPYDDDFKAAGCPAFSKSCRKDSYLVTGDLVLVGRTRGDFTCVEYQSPLAKNQIWTMGWLPSAALTPVAPMQSPQTLDWIGSWYHPGGHIEIRGSDGGNLSVEGTMTVPTPTGDFQNGDFRAQVTPRNSLAVTDEGSYGDGCHLRMQRVGPWLLVEDNGGCGGAGVTFTGLYRRQN
jgi:hypothetical protein